MALVSVVVPVYNGEKFLKKCIVSVLEQSFTDFELLIGDDHSQDACGKIVNQFYDKRIRYFFREKNLGIAGNINLLIQESRGELIHILCQDDILEPNCLATEIAFMRSHPEAVASYCKSYYIDEADRVIPYDKIDDTPEIIPWWLCAQLFWYHGCIAGNGSVLCLRKQSLVKAGLFNPQYRVAQDYEMLARLCKNNNLGCIHKRLARVRCHPQQQSRQVRFESAYFLETRHIQQEIWHSLPRKLHAYAGVYALMHQDVSQVHHAFKCIARGRISNGWQILRILGIKEGLMGFFCWLFTFNKRLYHPKPRFLAPNPPT